MSGAIHYYFDTPLPNELSATIQILKTGRAMAEAGRDFRLFAGPLGAPPDRLLADLGIAPDPRLQIEPAFPGLLRTPRLHRLAARAALLRARPGSDGSAVMTRGETGFLLAGALGRRRGPFVYELHRLAHLVEAERLAGRRLDLAEPLPPSALRLKRHEAKVIEAADGLVVLTSGLSEAIARIFPHVPPMIVVPSGVDVPERVPEARKDVDVVYVGKVERRKGVDTAIAALRYLPGRRLRIVGSGALDWAREHARICGVADRLDFVGRIPHEAVSAEFARARVGICPLPAEVDSISAIFTSPLKLLEMMAAGLPVVASDLPSVREVCRDGEQVLLVPPDVPEAMAGAVERLLAEPDLSARLGAAGRARARDFNWRIRAAQIANFADALGRRPVRRSARAAPS
jgi:glycosyltransferase involved in cell wall biosynthesis